MSGDDSSGSSSDSDDHFVDASDGPNTFTNAPTTAPTTNNTMPTGNERGNGRDLPPAINTNGIPNPPNDDEPSDSPLPPRAPTPTNSGSDSDVER